ncbi:MAG: exosome complex protein Rrp42 [Candidatus Aenigmarchaeota archaeon]|nr:exosome complex protein Rrp42 [Candidatus Aenigmarchaeota archaeon]
MTQIAKETLLASFNAGIHLDGRKLTEYRKLTITTNVSRSAEGSARVLLGDTDIIVGVKLALEKPYPDTPEKGNLMVNAELRPLSNPRFEVGPPGDEAVEIARVVDRGVREGEAIDARALCVKPGELVWSVMIDICTINAAGGLIDASGIGALTALINAKYPEHTEAVVHYEKRTTKSLPLAHQPLPVTVFKIGEHFLVDPLPEEEEHVDARLTIALTEKNHISALQKGGSAPLSKEDIYKMAEIAVKASQELRKQILREK